MCGRFTLILEPDEIQNELGLGDFPSELTPRYNIAPSQPIAVVANPKTRAVEVYRWGLIPSWAKDMAIGNRLINARSETLAEKPSFRSAFSRRRCLILADGFFEWRHSLGKTRGPSSPFYFQLENRKPFAFAGLWEFWNSPFGDEVYSATIITCAANDLVGQYHERMPVILDKDHMWDWLADGSLADLQSMLRPYPEEAMTVYPVSPMVNSPAVDSPEVIQPVQ